MVTRSLSSLEEVMCIAITVLHTKYAYNVKCTICNCILIAGISFEEVCFNYPSRPDEPVLKVSLCRFTYIHT